MAGSGMVGLMIVKRDSFTGQTSTITCRACESARMDGSSVVVWKLAKKSQTCAMCREQMNVNEQSVCAACTLLAHDRWHDQHTPDGAMEEF